MSDLNPISASTQEHYLSTKMEGMPFPATIRRWRVKLKLSQREEGAWLNVGESAFDLVSDRPLAEINRGPTRLSRTTIF
jgi:HTH-type transcriptional regulator/antitoxin MqsA